jgi:hypothetical protein
LNFWLLLLLLLLLLPLQPTFGTSRQFLIVVSHPKHPTLCVGIRQFVSDGAGLSGTLAPMIRIVDRDFGHGARMLTQAEGVYPWRAGHLFC